jgi:hypothetical protein
MCVGNSIINGTCWLAYFDVLGFRRQVLEFVRGAPGNLDVFVKEYYEPIIRSIELEIKNQQRYGGCSFEHAWFSDTFLFYVPDYGSPDSYRTIDAVTRHFLSSILREKTPFRGALAVGEFYADKRNSIFVGDALIEAYTYAEKQDWIGLVMAPSVPKRLEGSPLDANRNSDYVAYDVPTKGKELVAGEERLRRSTERLFARTIHKDPGVKTSIERMAKEAETRCPTDYRSEYGIKYENTLRFIRELSVRTYCRWRGGQE